MSQERARAFLSRLNDDEDLGEKADDAFVTALLAVARQAGYDMSEQDLRAALDGQAGALGDQQLDQVAGGFGRLANTVGSLGLADTLYGGGSLADTVYGSGLVQDTLLGDLSISSFSKKGFTR